MKKQLKFKFEVGDANYVKPGEYFVELTPDGTEIAAIYKRDDDLSLKSVISKTLAVETNKTVTASSASFTVNPSTGKDVMKKVTVTVPLEEGAQTKSIASLTAGDTLVLTPGTGKVGLSKVTITFTA